MSTTLSKGYKLPQDGDRTFWDDLEFNISRLNDHDHDGSDSAAISPKNLSKSTATISAGSWSSQGGGTYKQTITVPTGYAVNSMQVKFYVNGGDDDGREVFLSVRKVSSTTYDVFINNNSYELVAVYG